MPLPEDGQARTPRRARRALDPSDQPTTSQQPAVTEPARAYSGGSLPPYWNLDSETPAADDAAQASTSASGSAASAPKGRPKPLRGATSEPGGRRSRAFRGAMTRTVAGTIIPGLGLLGTRAHWLGVSILTVLIGGTAGLAIFVSRNPGMIAGAALRTERMFTIAIVLAALAAVWVAIITGTYLISKPRQLTGRQRKIGAAVVGVLSFAVSAPLGVGSAMALETASLSGTIFESEEESQSQTRPTLDVKDPWADKARVNILLLGGDSGEGRDVELGVRTDTMMMVSIDTASGNSVIIQLPRNLQHPIFPENSQLAEYFPYGFDNGGDSMLNAVWHDVPNMYPELFTNTDYPGADALKWAVEGVTGEKIDYFVMVNIDGLVNLVDAMGGVTVNVNFPIAIGGSVEWGNCGEGGWIADGPDRHLNGYEAMWYARSRCNDPQADFGRMQRQSCLVDAVIAQADAATMATRYEAIAQAAGDMVTTDIPQEHLAAIVDLANRVQRSREVSRLAFVNDQNGFVSAYPDFDLMHQQVADAIAASLPAGASPTTEGTEPAPEPTDGATEAPPVEEPTQPEQPAQPEQPNQGGGQPGEADASGSASADPFENVADACAYRYELPADWPPVPESVPRMTPPPSTAPEDEEGPR